jgi:hypothetical protein
MKLGGSDPPSFHQPLMLYRLSYWDGSPIIRITIRRFKATVEISFGTLIEARRHLQINISINSLISSL